MRRYNSQGCFSIAEKTKKIRMLIRQNELVNKFNAFRKAMNHQNQPIEIQNHHFNQQVQQSLVIMDNQIMQEAVNQMECISISSMHPTDPNIYFQNSHYIIYNILLGKGSSGNVWKGMIKLSGEIIAAKQLKKTNQNQINTQKDFNSQYIVKVLDSFQFNQNNYIILELCDRNLRQELAINNYFIDKILQFCQEIIIGVDLIQSKGIIHRDLKFQNIFVKNGKIKIGDFGFAKYLQQDHRVFSYKCGTNYTMAPQIANNLSSRVVYTDKCDIWAVGILLHELLYHIHPFNNSRSKLRKNSRVQTDRRFGLLDRIIDECLKINPKQRISWSNLKMLFTAYLREKHSIISSSKAFKYGKGQLYSQPVWKFRYLKFEKKDKWCDQNSESHEQRQRTPFRTKKQNNKIRRKIQISKDVAQQYQMRNYRFKLRQREVNEIFQRNNKNYQKLQKDFYQQNQPVQIKNSYNLNYEYSNVLLLGLIFTILILGYLINFQ